MRTTVTLSLVVATLTSATSVASQVRITPADYERARSLADRYGSVATGSAEHTTWVDSTSLWYRKSVSGGHTFFRVDVRSESNISRAEAFDHARLAAALTEAAPRGTERVTALTLPFEQMDLAGDGSTVSFEAWSERWSCSLVEYRCRNISSAGNQSSNQQMRDRDAATSSGIDSPDGRSVAYISNYNVHVRPSGTPPDSGKSLSTDGSEGNPYTIQTLVWSPDSRYIAVYRVRPGYRRVVRYIESSPTDQVQPKYFERVYAKPGDVLDLPQPALFDVSTGSHINVDPTLFPNPYSLSRPAWRDDSRAYTFEYNERGHQRYSIIEVNAQTGVARALVEETSKTFIDYRRASGTLTGGGRTYRRDVNDGNEIIWMSERDGWAHLYLYDGRTGAVKNQITRGDYVVRAVHRVDEQSRQIIFSAGGMNPGQDPYFAHYYRVNFDGSGLTSLTQAPTADVANHTLPADHEVTFSPDGRYYVDEWSRVDLAPVTQLKRTSDSKVLMELERGNLTALQATGWRPPEVFTSKGRDGKTDIWGVVFRPRDFNPRNKYPVIEYIYAGPHGSFVPKSFSPYFNMQSLAELGFVVVQIDGMGTANRSRAFHDIAWKNLGDAGFPDRILWHRAYAARNPWYDISRVGIFGGSAGGQNSLGALLFHPEFYKVAVSFAGCHDNRMDKIWWNEQWMGYPIGPEYEASSNVVNAYRLEGELLLVVPELDTNVDPSSTMQVVNALINADKTFDLLVMPGEDHGGGRRGPSAAYGDRKMWDFFVEKLHGVTAPHWNALASSTGNKRVGSRAEPPDLFGPSWASIEASWFEDRTRH